MAWKISGIVVGFVVVAVVLHVAAGGCYDRINEKKNCVGFLYKNLNVAECCDRNGKYYTLQNDSYENIFRFSMLQAKGGMQGVANCYSCEDWKKGMQKDKQGCKSKTCAPGQVCRMINNTVQCVCDDSMCQTASIRPVCSNYNKTYSSECKLNLTNCRTGRKERIEYDGPCQASCSKVHCRTNKQCIEDLSRRLHCVRCNITPCLGPFTNSTAVCGLNNITYKSACHLRKASCQLGKTIGIAYTGSCRADAKCSNIKCVGGQKCVMIKHEPLCMDCSGSCKHIKPLKYSKKRFCGSNGVVYPNFCSLRQNICLGNENISIVDLSRCKVYNATRKVHRVTMKQIKMLRAKSLSTMQFIRIVQTLGFQISLLPSTPKDVLHKKISVHRLLCFMYRSVTKDKLSPCNTL